MNFTREDHPQLGCGADVEAAFDQLAQQANSAQPATSAQPDASFPSVPPAPPEPSSPPAEPRAEKRAPRSFQTPPRSGRGRLASREHAPVRNLGSHTDGTGRVLLPIDLRDELEEQAILEYEAGRAERAALALARMEAEEEKKRAKSSRQPTEAKPPEEEAKDPGKQVGKRVTGSRRAGEITSLVNPTCFREQVAALPTKKRLAVYSPDALKKLQKGSGSVDSEVHKRNAQLFEQLHPKGPNRRVGLARSIDAVLALQNSHPHFSEVIEFVADRIALQKHSRRPVRLPPMMLFGPPGVGKTHFCESLAAVLHVPVRRHPMDQAETSSALLGSDLSWGNTRYGLVFELLALGDHANPVVILDELDKAGRTYSSSGTLTSPTSVLHSLLEPVSALRVRDISLDIELDASLITWIATANYPWLVAPTLRSRMKEFLIQMPTAEQSLLVATSVVAQAIKDSGILWSELPDRRFIAAVAHLSAREIYQATATAAATAVRRTGKVKPAVRRVEVSDLPLEVLLADETGEVPQRLLH
ncbi:MAG: AAA family ATPase [Hydrogenophaga sp.]|uniref:AAA family ATPase n=1 Tax=Hydrogenophaga sp. TaxID=1904254 RepID=UPI0027359548|nr:AAA family ATPase [Hydrogenophaga sp.]MDP3626118.1 AAA family ATPase [Hydrogenophaga sp.]